MQGVFVFIGKMTRFIGKKPCFMERVTGIEPVT